MKVKELDRTANIAWSPKDKYPIYLAAGTAAQQLDSTFSTSAQLELYLFDVNLPGLDMPLKASFPCESRFHKLVWGRQGIGDKQEHPSVIVGGCDDGIIKVFDPEKLLKNEDPVLLTTSKHTGPVRALDFNKFRPHLVASGASDSEIYIWDLTNSKQPMTPGNRSQPADDVAHLSWNNQVEHILASTYSARCVFWDLRKSEPIIKLADPTAKIKYKVCDWHPDIATQICLASEEDSNPVIQLWDLRYATAPLKTLHGHERGVLGLDWCSDDPELLISCGRDNRILCWNPNFNTPGYEMIGEIQTSNQWCFNVSFCPRNPLIISSASFDSRISIFTLSGGAQLPVTSSKLADSFPGMDMSLGKPVPSTKPTTFNLRDAPKWQKVPYGVSFGFGGKLISFENIKASTTQGQETVEQRLVNISQIVTLPKFIEKSQRLEDALKTGDLSNFCEEKASESVDENETETWKFLQANFSQDRKLQFIDLLGFKIDTIKSKLSQLIPKEKESATKTNEAINAIANLNLSTSSNDFFENQFMSNGIDLDEIEKPSESTEPDHQFKIATDESKKGYINQALLIGDIELAVELCLKDELWADALILASCGGEELVRKAQLKYFQSKSQNDTSNMIRAIVTQDLNRLVEKCELKYWKQALATVLTYCIDENYLSSLSEILGSRLEQSGDENLMKNSLLCYICSGNMNRLVESWVVNNKENIDTPDGLQSLVEQLMILKKSAEYRGISGIVTGGVIAAKLVQYASLLASQGCLQAALQYLADSNDPSIVSLRERLHYSLGLAKAAKPPRSRNTSLSEAANYNQNQYNPNIKQRPGYPATSSNVAAATNGPNNFSFRKNSASSLSQSAVQHLQSQPATPTTAPPATNYPYYNPAAAAKDTSQQSYGSGGGNYFTPNIQQQNIPPPPPGPSLSQSAVQHHQPPQATVPPATNYPYFNPAAAAKDTSQPQPSYGSGGNYFTPSIQQPNVPPPPLAQGPALSQSAIQHHQPQPTVAPPPPATNYPYFNPATAAVAAKDTSQQSYGSGGNYFTPNIQQQQQPNISPSAPPLHQTNATYSSPNASNIYNPSDSIKTTQPQKGIYPTLTPLSQQQEQQPLGANISNPLPSQPSKVIPNNTSIPSWNDPPPRKVKASENPKGPIQAEHKTLIETFDKLRSNCYEVATLPQMKRKLEDVARKIEIFADKLRSGTLSQVTLDLLLNMVDAVKNKDYTQALTTHKQLVTAGNFYEISTFLPAIKILIQSASQLGVYV